MCPESFFFGSWSGVQKKLGYRKAVIHMPAFASLIESERPTRERQTQAALNIDTAWDVSDSASARETAERHKSWESDNERRMTYPFQGASSRPAAPGELARAYFENPMSAGTLRSASITGDDSIDRMHTARITSTSQMLQPDSSNAILPLTTMPTDAASAEDTSVISGVRTRIKRGIIKDRLGRSMCLFEAPMPAAQRDHGQRDHSSRLEMAMGRYASRQRVKREVEGEINSSNRENDPRLYEAAQNTTEFRATVGDTALNGKHKQAFSENDWERNQSLYDGLNPNRVPVEKRVVRPTTTQRSRMQKAAPPLRGGSAVDAARTQTTHSVNRDPTKRVHVEDVGASVATSTVRPKNPLIVVKEVTPLTQPRPFEARGKAISVPSLPKPSQFCAPTRLDASRHEATGNVNFATAPAIAGKQRVPLSCDARPHDVLEVYAQALVGGHSLDGAVVRVDEDREQTFPEELAATHNDATDAVRMPIDIGLSTTNDRNVELPPQQDVPSAYQTSDRSAEQTLGSADDVAQDESKRTMQYAHRDTARVASTVRTSTTDARTVQADELVSDRLAAFASQDRTQRVKLAKDARAAEAERPFDESRAHGAPVHAKQRISAGDARVVDNASLHEDSSGGVAAARWLPTPHVRDEREFVSHEGPVHVEGMAKPENTHISQFCKDDRQTADEAVSGAGSTLHSVQASTLPATQALSAERPTTEHLAKSATLHETRNVTATDKDVHTQRTEHGAYSHSRDAAFAGESIAPTRLEGTRHALTCDAPAVAHDTIKNAGASAVPPPMMHPRVLRSHARAGTADTDRLTRHNPANRRPASPAQVLNMAASAVRDCDNSGNLRGRASPLIVAQRGVSPVPSVLRQAGSTINCKHDAVDRDAIRPMMS